MSIEQNPQATQNPAGNSIAEKISYLAETKNLIKSALEAKGAALEGSPFRDYAQAIEELTPAEAEPSLRSEEWLPLPQVPTTGNHIYALMAVWPDTPNAIAFKATAQSIYTVEWGNGETQNVISGAIAQNTYNFADLPESTLTSGGYKQVMIHIYGTNLTEMDFQQLHSAQPSIATNLLELIVDAPTLTTLLLCQDKITVHPYLERAELRRCPLTSMLKLFDSCNNLKEVPVMDFSATTSISYTFKSCGRLVKVPDNISAPFATIASYLFRECTSLERVGDVNLPLVENITNIFGNCRSLKSVKSFYTPAVLNSMNAFIACTNMEVAPEVDLPLATSISGFFSDCSSLKRIPKFRVPSLTSYINNAFLFCYALEYVGLEGISKAINISLAKTRLNRAELVRIFNLLPRGTGSATLDITEAAGSSHLTEGDRLLFTSKGWQLNY